MMAFSGCKIKKEALKVRIKIHWDQEDPNGTKNTNNSERV